METGEVGQVIEQLGWVAWAGTVIELRGFVEGRPEWRYFMPVVAMPRTK